MKPYNWQQDSWPNFTYDASGVEDELYVFAEKTGSVNGFLTGLSGSSQLEAVIDNMVAEAIKTSEIEGEYFSRQDVMSSIRNNLGLNATRDVVINKKAAGAGDLVTDVKKTYSDALTTAKLFEWHTMLMSDATHLQIGEWRTHDEPMQVISGAMGKEKIHFEAPPSSRVPQEMELFIKWFNQTAPGGVNEIKKAPVRSAIAHLYFESIHPFEDGNGRIGRAIAEKALSQGIGRPVLLSLSRTIEANKKHYYSALENGQRSNEITPWLKYFVGVILNAQIFSEQQISFSLKKAKFFDHFNHQLNERQAKVVARMLEEGPQGFRGGMTAAKYIAITKTSKATATRDLQHLVEIEAFVPSGAGRNTAYQVSL